MYKKQKYTLLNILKSNQLFDILKDRRVILAGGAIRSLFTHDRLKDFDLYFETGTDLSNVLNDLLSDKWKMVSNTSRAFTLSNPELSKHPVQLIQYEKFFVASPIDLFKYYDFTICMGAFDFRTREIVLDERFLLDLARRELIFNSQTEFPIASLIRINKYLSMGYTIPSLELVKLALRIHSLKITTVQELKEQLDGIDTAFLAPITNTLEGNNPETDYDYAKFLDTIVPRFEEMIEEIYDTN